VFYGDQGSSVLNGWPKHLWQWCRLHWLE
jgi:hypothetical protein